MIQKPAIPEIRIIDCLRDDYHLLVNQLNFLPIGVDQHVAVYRADTSEGKSYFVKLRKDGFNEATLVLTKFLRQQGIEGIIAPLETKTGELYASIGVYRLVLAPFIQGQDAYQTRLSGSHWQSIGQAIKSVHTAKIPLDLKEQIQEETFSRKWREMVKTFLERINVDVFEEPIKQELSRFFAMKRDQVNELVATTERLAEYVSNLRLPFVLCHGDLHGGNLFIVNPKKLYIVDWDEPVFAPKERDLMYVGAGLGGSGCSAQEENQFFYRGYGQACIEPAALAYYRFERIIQDLAVFSEQIFSDDQACQDRKQALHFLKSNFDPQGVLDIAYQAYREWSRNNPV